MSIVIAVAGKIGSGKTTITRAVAEALSWPRASFGDYVRNVARGQGLMETRQNLQAVGTRLLRSDVHQFCLSVLASSEWNAGGNLVIDGLRHVETIAVIRQLVRPAMLKIAFISLPETTRLERLQERGEGDPMTTLLAEAHSSEQQVNSGLREIADFVIDGDRPVSTIVEEISEWVSHQEES